MKTQYVAGVYRLTPDTGPEITLTLTAQEARILFRLHSQLGFPSIELVE